MGTNIIEIVFSCITCGIEHPLAIYICAIECSALTTAPNPLLTCRWIVNQGTTTGVRIVDGVHFESSTDRFCQSNRIELPRGIGIVAGRNRSTPSSHCTTDSVGIHDDIVNVLQIEIPRGDVADGVGSFLLIRSPVIVATNSTTVVAIDERVEIVAETSLQVVLAISIFYKTNERLGIVGSIARWFCSLSV